MSWPWTKLPLAVEVGSSEVQIKEVPTSWKRLGSARSIGLGGFSTSPAEGAIFALCCAKGKAEFRLCGARRSSDLEEVFPER